MTREEAIKILADLTDNLFLHTWEEQYKALHMAIEALQADAVQGEWIPCSERLPSMRTEVIYSFDGIVSTGYMTDRDFNGEKMELHWEDLESGATIEPIAWMPLPKPYREDDEA